MAELNFAGPVTGQKNITEPLNLNKALTPSVGSWDIRDDKEENLIQSLSLNQEPLKVKDETVQAVQKPATLSEATDRNIGAKQASSPPASMQDFAVPVTQEQWSVISKAASQSSNPEEELDRYAAALTFSREYGVDMDTALQNLDAFSQYQLGKPYTPNSTSMQAIANSFKVGRMNMSFNDLAYKFKQADLKGEDVSGILSELDAMGNEIAALKDYQPRNIATTALKWTMEGAIPYMIEVGKASLVGATAAGALGTAFTGVTGIALGSLAAASPYTLASIIAMGATVGAVNRTRELTEGASYLSLRQIGIDRDVANVFSRANGMIVGAIEAGLGIEAGTAIKAVGGQTLATRVSSAVTAKMVSSGALGSIAKAAVATGVNASGEFVQEAVEEAVDITFTHISHAIQEMRSDIDPLPDESAIKRVLYAGYRGFVSAVILGGPSAVMDTHFNLKEQTSIAKEAEATASREAFIDNMKDSKPEAVTGEDWANATSQVWEKAHQGKQTSTAIQTEESARNELDFGAGEKAKGPVRRLSTNELYTSEDGTPTVDTDGAEHHRMLVGDPATGNRYGHIEYEISDNTLTINDVRFRSNYESIRQESVLALAKQFAGYEIQWDAKGENLQAIKDTIIENNPRGKDAGMQYYDGVTDVDERIELDKTIGTAMPTLNASERALGATLVQLMAEAKGQSTQAYLQDNFKDGQLFGNVEDMDAAMQGKKGAVAFTDDMKAIIYAGEHADFSTFIHETFHVALRNIGQTDQFRSAVADAAQTPEFTTWLDDHAELFQGSVFDGKDAQGLAEIAAGFNTDSWSRVQEEFAARLYEGYRADGKVASPKLQGIFQRIAEWMGRIYTTLRHSVALDPRITAAFDSIVDKDSQIAQAAQEKQGASETKPTAQQEALYQEIDAQRQYEAVVSEYTGTDAWMKAPNGEDTNLNERQWVQVRTPSFLEWFGDWMKDPENASKVVDENGEPLVVYHGGTNGIEEFNLDAYGKYGLVGIGIYTTENESVANGYANSKRDRGEVYKFFEKIQNPVDFNKKVQLEKWSKIFNNSGFETPKNIGDMTGFEAYKAMEQEFIDNDYAVDDASTSIQEIMSENWDGITHIGGLNREVQHRVWVAFSPTQIKSATGNNGNFSKSNPSILFQEDGKVALNTDYPKKLTYDEMQEIWDSDEANKGKMFFGNVGKFLRKWEEELKQWLEGKPDLLQFGDEQLIHVIHKNVNPDEGPWRSTTFLKRNDDWLPLGHTAYDTKFEAVKQNVGSENYRPDILFQEAYHGTGATFDKFDPEFMGDGEGSQAYGWGFYLSDSFPVSNNYRIIASYDPDMQKINGRTLSDEYDRIETLASKTKDAGWLYEVLEGLEMLMMHETRASVIAQLQENEASKRSIKYFSDARYKTFGNVYITEFSDDMNIVDYYAPLSENDYNRLVESLTALGIEQDNEVEMQDMIDALSPDLSAAEVYGRISGTLEDDANMKRGTSEFFDSIGVNGFFYPAKDQQGAESETGKNYVIFNPDKIKIKSPVLFQEETNDVTEQILEDARGFETWEGLKYYYEGIYGYDIYGDQLDEPYKDDEWYQTVFNEANGISETAAKAIDPQQSPEARLADENHKDEYIREKLMDDKSLTAFVEKMGWVLTTKEFENNSPGKEDRQYAETVQELRKTIPTLVHRTIVSNALRTVKGKEITPSSLKRIRTLMTGDSIRYYRDIYADVMEDPNLKPQVIDERLPAIEGPGYNVTGFSITDRIKLADKIEAAPLKKAILSGKETVEGSAEKVIIDMDRDITDLTKQISEAQEELDLMNAKLSDSEQLVAMYYTQLTDAKRQMDSEMKEIRRLTNEDKRIPDALIKSSTRLRDKIDLLHDQVMKNRASERVNATVKRQEALASLKAQLKEKQAAKDEAKKVRAYKQKLARTIMVRPSDAINYDQAQMIYKIQATLDPAFRQKSVEMEIDGEPQRVTIAEAKEALDGVSDEELREAVGQRLYERITEQRKPLNDWTIAELEETLETIADLRTEGRTILAAKNEQKKIIARNYQDSIIRSLMATGKYTSQPLVGTKDDQREKNHPKNTVRGFIYSTYAMRVKAMKLDNNTQGTAYRLLVSMKRAAQDAEFRAIERRMAPVFKVMKEVGITEKDLYQTEFIRLGERTEEYTYSAMMYAWLSQHDESNRNAVAYGNIVSKDEKIALNHDNESIEALGDARYDQLLEQVHQFLVDQDESGRYMALVKAVQADFNAQAPRLNEIAIREFNKAMRVVEQYLPIHRKEFSGADMRQQVAEDLFNAKAGANATGVAKGFQKDRIFISPDHQTPVNLDLMGVWNKSARQQEHFIAFAEYGRMLNRVFKNQNRGSRDLENAINRTYGKEMYQDVTEYMNEVINPQVDKKLVGMEKGVKFMRGNLGAAYLTWKMSGLVLQAITSPMPYLANIRADRLIKAYFDIFAHPIQSIEFISEKSAMMKNRTMNVIIDQILQESKTYTDNWFVRANRKQQEIGSMGLTLVDRYAVAGGWLAAYQEKLGELEASGMVTAEADDQAVTYADDLVLKVQPTGDATELAPLFKTGSEFARAFTQFQTSLNVIWSNLTYDMPQAFKNSRNNALPKAVRQQQFSQAVGTIVGYALAGALLGAVADGYDDDDDMKDKIRKWIYWSFTQATGSVPLIGDQVDAISRSFWTGDKPVFFGDEFFPGVSKLLKGVGYLTQADIGKGLRNLAEGAGYVGGAPVSGLKQIEKRPRKDPESS